MAVAELLNEIVKSEYAGLSDEEIVAVLNEWQRTFIPCSTKSLSVVFAEFGMHGLVEVAREKGILGDDLWTRWKMLLGVMADPEIREVMFDSKPIVITDFFNQLLTLGVVANIQHVRLMDLGVRSSTIGRRVFARDVREADLVAARDLTALNDKVAARRDFVANEYERMLAEVSAAHEELQKRDADLNPIGSKAFVPPWEK